MRIPRRRSWPTGSAPCLTILVSLLLASSTSLYAGCKGANKLSPQAIAIVHNLFSPATAPSDFHVYAETLSTDRQTDFVLYSATQPADSNTQTVYLAAMRLEPKPNILSAIEVSTYLPAVAHAIPYDSGASLPDSLRSPGSTAVDIDGCLNAFVLKPDLQAVHMNLFARSEGHGNEGANDIIFVLLDQIALRPVLELNQSSWYDQKGLHQDSVIAVSPSTTMATDLIWWQSSQQGAGIMAAAAYDQNKWYRWTGRGFQKMGSLEQTDLAARLQSAFRLTRSDAISAVEMRLIAPGPSQPSP